MKKISVVLLICSTLLLSACSTDKKEAATDSTSKQITVNSSSKERVKKEAAEKKKAEEAEKKKQEEISKKVVEADAVMKVAESNPTDETIASAKAAIEVIPGGNPDLSKRLEVAQTNLQSIKQQAAVQAQQQTQSSDQGPVVITGAPPMTEEERQTRESYARMNEEAARANGIDPSQKPQTPPTHVDDQGRQYIFENHDAYKDEPYYTEDWKNNPSPYQD